MFLKIMETDCKRKKTKKRESCEERSPLQHLNGLPIHKRNSDLSSSSSAPAASRLLISDNPCSSSSFYSTSRTHLDKEPKNFSKLANNEPSKSRVHTSNMGPRFKENEMPRKPFMQTSRKDKPQFITQRQNWPSNAKPTCKIRQRSKHSSAHGKSEDKMKKGSREFQEKRKTSTETDSGKCTFELNRASNGSNSNCAENCTPVSGRVASGYGLDTPNLCDHEFNIEDSTYEGANSNANTAIDVKTPPVEPSLSPEIQSQSQSQSKMLVLKSVGTPVCYGTGHLLSGVSDKRKSRRRGSLRGGPEKAILFSDARRDENVSVDLKESSIPLLAEASVRWHLSPCDVGRGDHTIGSGNRLCDDDTGTLDLLSSPSMLCGNALDFLCAKSSYGGSVGNVAVNRRSTDVISSPRKATEFPRVLEPLSCNMDVSLLATPPSATYCSNGISSTEGKYFSKSSSRGSSILSSGSLNSGNIIQTPDTGSSSDACFGMSRLEVHLSSNSVRPELDPITKTLERMKLSPRSEMSTWDDPGLGTSSADMGSPPIPLDPTQFQRNGDSVSSWASDTTTDNPTLSQMRISWCDVLASKTAGTDEFDCCCCLSDEEIEGDESLTEVAEEKETCQSNDSGLRNYIGDASVENKEDGFRIENEFSPVLLDYEPCIPAGGKGKSSSSLPSPDACAESICTDGGGLVASDDSDWTYFQETACFMSHKEV